MTTKIPVSINGINRRDFISATLAAGLTVPMVSRGADLQAEQLPPIAALARRVMGPRAVELIFETIGDHNDLDVFEVQGMHGKITLCGNNTVAQAVALNCFLRECCHSQVSWTGDQIHLPAKFSVPGTKIRRNALVRHRYFLNYCTFSYTMAFWDWPRWQQELDWMALNGINLALAAVIGQECIWQNVMRRMGQSEEEIRQFIAGPAFTPWWLMDNLEAWGGPVWEDWLENRRQLQTQIVTRMRSLGIQPVFQGFYGMVPSSLKKHYPRSKIIGTGRWCMFSRPPMLLPGDPLFDRMAAIWYEEQHKLFGEALYFGGDPFHEGAVPAGVDLGLVGRGVESAMQKAKPGAVWVMQGWQENPRQRMLDGTAKSNTLILDLWGDGPEGGFYHKRKNWSGHPWIWCIISNFGGNLWTYGRWDRIAQGPFDALKKGRMCGIGAAMEGTVDYPTFQLLFDLAWYTEKPNLTKWTAAYAVQRYGGHCKSAVTAWELLKSSVYNSKVPWQSSCVFCNSPDGASWSSSIQNYAKAFPYDRGQMVLALRNLLDAADHFEKVPTYQFDITDITRQVLDNLGLWQYGRMIAALKQKLPAEFDKESHLFLNMILDEDRLLKTQEGFLLGHWIAAARAFAETTGPRQLLETDARTLITVWGPKPGWIDYSGREWVEMLRNFYFPRWQLWVRQQQSILKGNSPQTVDYFAWARARTYQHITFSAVATGDSIREARRIINKYKSIFQEANQ